LVPIIYLHYFQLIAIFLLLSLWVKERINTRKSHTIDFQWESIEELHNLIKKQSEILNESNDINRTLLGTLKDISLEIKNFVILTERKALGLPIKERED